MTLDQLIRWAARSAVWQLARRSPTWLLLMIVLVALLYGGHRLASTPLPTKREAPHWRTHHDRHLEWLNSLRNGEPVRDKLVDEYIAGFINAEVARQIWQAVRDEFPDMSLNERSDLIRARLAAHRAPEGHT